MEWANIQTNWLRPMQKKRAGGGLCWTNEQYLGTRAQCMHTMQEEMRTFREHEAHVIYHKAQTRHLLETFAENEIVIKSDFIQNISHTRGRETTQSYYGKRQTQFLSFVVWYYALDETGTVAKYKINIDYLSSYLNHNSMYFQKCARHLLTYLRETLEIQFSKVNTYIYFYLLITT